MNLKSKYFILSLSVIMIFGCNGGHDVKEKMIYRKLNDVPELKWIELSKKKIFFGHQSVGQDIIDGVNDIIKNNPKIKLNIVNISKIEDNFSGYFSHQIIGENGNPHTKIDEFKKIVEKNKFDIALFKFCYIDISKETDIERLFVNYKDIMDKLTNDKPDTKFLHATIPLTTSNIIFNIKIWLKKLMWGGGIKWKLQVLSQLPNIWNKEDNIARNIYNDKLKNNYSEVAIFDIAKYESTNINGKPNIFQKDDNEFRCLVTEYSSDGEHLNQLGKQILAENFLLFLINHN